MRRGSTSGTFDVWTQRLDPSTVGMLWALAALKWRRGYTGATYEALRRALGVSHRSSMRRAIIKAEATRLVRVKMYRRRRCVVLTPEALRRLDALWT